MNYLGERFVNNIVLNSVTKSEKDILMNESSLKAIGSDGILKHGLF